jgi:hypothetical protein
MAIAGSILIGCGNGGSNVVPPPPSGNFSNASMKGQYAYSVSGEDLNGAFAARIGTFTADGNGNITGGLEDMLDLGSGSPAAVISISGGTYQIQANGTGVITLETASAGLQLNVALQTSSVGTVIQTDLNATGSGTLSLQTSADFVTAALTGPYVFDFSGVSFAGTSVAPISMIGQLQTDGNGNITGGVMDTNESNPATPSGATAITPGTYQLDAVNGPTFGRGEMNFNGRNYAFYIVDVTHIKVLEEDDLGGAAGDALEQTAGIPTLNSGFTGSFVYLIGGVSTLGTQGPVARVARFTADGNGGLGAISLDDNDNGEYRHISQGSNISAATYAIDTSYAGSGRGTFTFTDSGGGTYSDIFYLISPAQGVAQETSKGIIGDGPMYAQTAGPFTVSGSVGSYVSNWTGVSLGTSTAVPYQEDFVGQFALSNATNSNISGVTDYVQLGLSNKTLFSNVGLGGTLTIRGDGTANNLYKFVLGSSPSVTVNFQAYYTNPGIIFLVCSDNTRTTAGVLKLQ